jgi:hypothetical protein
MTQTPRTQTASRLATIARVGTVAVAGIIAGALAAGTGASAATVYTVSSTLYRIANPAINESSGIVASGGIYFTHNDGAVNKFYAINAQGKTLGTYSTPGVPTSRSDWEDMAQGTDAAGNPALFFGDTGDNARSRPEIAVIRVNKPAVDVTKLAVTATATGITRYRFAYPDGPKDAESIAVQPGTNRITTTLNTLVKVGTVTIPGATGAAFSADGTKFVVRQYKNAAVYKITDNDLTAAIKTVPVALAMPSQLQGEAITFNPTGTQLVLSSEGQYAPVLTQTSPV